ncbi:MAG: type IV pilin protein [Gammaproteobacteria bacterium]
MAVTVEQNKGVTLIELMIVIAILAIISAIAIPAYTGYIKTARIQECQQEVASLSLAEEEFFLEQRTYFAGADIATLEISSQGLWRAAEQVAANRNCTYSIVAGANGIATSYVLTATGSNKLATEGVVVTKTRI